MKKETSTSNTASDTCVSIFHLLGHRNKICPLTSFCRDSAVTNILIQSKKHQNTGGKSQELTQVDGILLFPLVPISNTSVRKGRREGRLSQSWLLQLKALSTRAAHLAFCSNTVTVYHQFFARALRALWLCNFAWFWQIFLSMPAYDRQRSCLQN